MDFRVLSSQGVTDLIEKQFPQKLTSFDISRDNILFYVTTGSQFNKLIDKCGVEILNKPCLSGDYYVNEVIRSKLLPAIEAGDTANATMYSTFYSIIVGTYGISQVIRCSNERKETSMHLLRKAIADGIGGETWKPKLEELYKLAVGKLTKKMVSTLVDVDGYNVNGEFVAVPVTTPAATPLATPVASPVVTLVTTPTSTLSATPRTPVVVPAITPSSTTSSTTRYTFLKDLPEFTEIPPNPFSQQSESPRDSNNIVIVKGYEYHFIPSTLRNHLKTIRK